MSVVGTVIVMPTIIKHLRIHETTFFLYAVISSALGLTVVALSVKTWMAFLGK